jgi:O-antigen/teichoic acid export membrane protein
MRPSEAGGIAAVKADSGPAVGGTLWPALRQLLFGKAMLTVAGQGIVSAANFATSIMIGRSSKEELGLYVLGFSIVLFAVNSQNALITSAYMVYSPRMEGEALAQYTGSSLIHQLTLALIIMAGVACGAAFTMAGYGPEGLTAVLLVLACVVGLYMLKEYGRQISFAKLHTGTALILDAGVATMQIAGLAALFYFGLLNASRAFLVIGLGAGFAGLTWLLFRRDQFSPRVAVAPGDFRRNWTFGKWIFAQNLAFVATNQVYPWLLTGFHDTEATGAFGACSAIIFFSNPFILGLSNFLGPKTVHAFTHGGPAEMSSVVNKASIFFVVTMGFFCLVVFALGEWALVLLYGESFAGYGWTISTLAVGQLVWSYTIPANFGLNAMERPDVAFKSLLLALIITATVGVWLVYSYGPLGVAAGLLMGNIASCIFNRYMYRREWHKYAAQGEAA